MIRWPWVARSTLEQAEARIADLKAALAARDADVGELRADNRSLAANYHELRVQHGANAFPVQPLGAPKGPDPVYQAILSRAGGNPALRQHYTSMVAELRASGVSESLIAEEVLKSVDVTNEGIPG